MMMTTTTTMAASIFTSHVSLDVSEKVYNIYCVCEGVCERERVGDGRCMNMLL